MDPEATRPGAWALFDLRGRVALVTGSSRGIGSAIALGLGEAGADVAVHCARRATEAEDIAEEIARRGARATVAEADLRDADACRRLVDEVGERLGPVDVLVLNASTEVRRNWLDIDRSDFEEQVAVNLRASFVLLQATVPAMAQRGWGRVISIGSLQEKGLIPPSWSTRPSRARSSTWF